jgi:hypothetical protein
LAGFEPATFESSSKHTNHYTIQATLAGGNPEDHNQRLYLKLLTLGLNMKRVAGHYKPKALLFFS